MGLQCVRCSAQYEPSECWTCLECDGILDVQYDMDRVKGTLTRAALSSRPATMWRYAELLPLDTASARPAQPVGWTPILNVPRLAEWCTVSSLQLKDDSRNPSASFKDRASAVAATHAGALGLSTLACASTGNAASSLAGMTASMGQKAVIFIPENAPEPKVAQLLAYGATVVKVRGGYAAAYDLCNQACRAWGWYNRNCAINPFLVEGKKTCGLEIGEQLGDTPPDWVVVSVGDGCTIAGVYKGMREMAELGLLVKLPRLLGVQADGARPLVDAFESNDLEVTPQEVNTIADSISVGTPRNDMKALAAVRATGGTMISVSDAAILDAVATTPRLSGVFGEPAGVAGVAGLKAAIQAGMVERNASVLVVITGSGLKDTRAARMAVGEPLVANPDLEQLAQGLRAHGTSVPS